MKRSFIREILESINKDTISFAGGLPDESMFPIEDLKSATNKVFSNPKVLQYSISSGIKELREKIAHNYSLNGFESDIDNILITTGSQQAMYIVAKYFQNRDILIEEPSYLGAMNIFKINNLKMKPIKLENDGIELNSFEENFKNIKLAYLIPDFQNPSSITYSDLKREKVVNIIKKYNGILIEDSPYSELYFDKRYKPISLQIPKNSFHIGSFSKTLSPSLRVGWIRADKELIKSITIIKESIDLHTCGTSQYILNEYLSDESRYLKHLNNLREKYHSKMEFFAKTLDTKLPNFKYNKPKGGMFIYGKIENIDSFKLVKNAMKNGVVFVPASEFYIDDKISSEIRFNFTHSSLEDIKRGISLIAKTLFNE